MKVVILAVPGCPNAPVLEERLAAALEGRSDVAVTRHVVAEESEAARWGMHGSPTILVDGADPFARPGQAASLSCRLYRGDDGAISHVPSLAQLRRALAEPAPRPYGGPS
jgi:hypothetical protein